MNSLIGKLHVCRDNFGTPSISDGVLYYNPADGGFQCEGYGEWDRQHIALTSYEAFGCNYPNNVEAARRWEESAAEAWPVVFSEQALEEYDRQIHAKKEQRRQRRHRQ